MRSHSAWIYRARLALHWSSFPHGVQERDLIFFSKYILHTCGNDDHYEAQEEGEEREID